MIGNKTGNLGENIVEKFLTKRGFNVFTRNFVRKFGEIDLIAERDGITHFIEVKSVSREIREDGISRETSVRPEENLHGDKLRRLSRIVQSYILSKKIDRWQFDLCVVYIDTTRKKAQVKMLENLILPE